MFFLVFNIIGTKFKMLLKCDYSFMNRLAPGQETKKTHATISVGKKKKASSNEEEVYFLVHTAKNKSGTKFQVRSKLFCLK